MRFLLVSGELDDARGAWSAPTGSRSTGAAAGSSSPREAIWHGQRDGAQLQERDVGAGGTPSTIYAYWQEQVGMAGTVMIDPQQHADTLFQVARRVGAL